MELLLDPPVQARETAYRLGVLVREVVEEEMLVAAQRSLTPQSLKAGQTCSRQHRMHRRSWTMLRGRSSRTSRTPISRSRETFLGRTSLRCTAPLTPTTGQTNMQTPCLKHRSTRSRHTVVRIPTRLLKVLQDMALMEILRGVLTRRTMAPRLKARWTPSIET